jgi:hypothetical protein
MNLNNKNTSVVVDLENLQQKYSNLVNKYKRAVSDYLNYLNVPEHNKRSFVHMSGFAYTGTGTAGQSNATTLQNCEANCASNSKCTGATFVSNKCELRTGESVIVPSSDNSYAIVPKAKQLLLNMENINQELIRINEEITEKLSIGEPVYYEVKGEIDEKSITLKKNYDELIEERDSIKKLLNEYETLNRTEGEEQIKITQNYYSYILLFILVIASILLLIKMTMVSTPSSNIQYGGQLGINAYYFLLIIILIIVILNLFAK